MASIISSVTNAAHSAAVSLLSSATIEAGTSLNSSLVNGSLSRERAGGSLPIKVPVKEHAADDQITFETLTGKNVFVSSYGPDSVRQADTRTGKVTVPGAFTGTCTRQVPGYAGLYQQFKDKGVDNIYIVAVNDVFVMQLVPAEGFSPDL